jgi:hypothetical protein
MDQIDKRIIELFGRPFEDTTPQKALDVATTLGRLGCKGRLSEVDTDILYACLAILAPETEVLAEFNREFGEEF